MTQTGQVAAFTGVRKPFALREYPVPSPAAGAMLVKVRMANVCGSDLHIWRGDYDVSRGHSEPFCLSIGHEMAGEVAVLGEGVTHDSAGQSLAVGDRIVYQYFCPCGRCRSCLRRSTPRCLEALRYRYPPDEYPHFNAAYGQYYYLNPGQAVFKIPDNVSGRFGRSGELCVSASHRGLSPRPRRAGDHVVIQGAGGLGINAVAVAREMGVAQIIVIDAIESRLELARAFGADETMLLDEYPAARRSRAARPGINRRLGRRCRAGGVRTARRSCQKDWRCWPKGGRIWKSATSTRASELKSIPPFWCMAANRCWGLCGMIPIV